MAIQYIQNGMTMETVTNTINSNFDGIFNLIYPIGSIYITVNSTSPATLFGGTWVQIKDTFLLSAGDTYTAGSTGGEATHTLTVNEMPSHKHSVNEFQVEYPYANTAGGDTSGITLGNTFGRTTLTIPVHNTNNTGGGQSHNNMPPYLTVYMWKRTA